MRLLRFEIFVIIVLAAMKCAATQYRTHRLTQIAQRIGLVLPDSLSSDMTIDSISSYKGKTIYLRTNAFEEITHIGYKLFNDSIINQQKRNEPVFHFVERYLLELDLKIDGRNPIERMDLDRVILVKGTIGMFHKIKTDTPVVIDEISRRMFRFTWIIDNKQLCISFPASCQLILGGNAIELEDIAVRDIKRFIPITADQIISDWSAVQVSEAKGLYVHEGGYFISEMIRGDIFFTEKKGKRKLLCDISSPTKSISNIMITGMFEREIPMILYVNKYGQKTDSLNVTLQQFISFCKADGCKLFVGIKSMNMENVSCTLFALNEKLGYDHLLSTEFPLCILSGGDKKVTGTAYVYIPLNDIKEDFFNQFKIQ